MFRPTPALVPADDALPGRAEPVLDAPQPHAVLATPITGPWQDNQRSVLVGVGCFWGPEKLYWQLDGVVSTSVGYAGGVTPNPTYQEVCSGRTNHAEVVEVVYDPDVISLREIIALALEDHDPTQGFRQGNDVGTQYRSAFYTLGEHAAQDKELIEEMVADYGRRLAEHGYGEVTTEIAALADTPSGQYYRAEDYHQQYLHKVPDGYCPTHATGVACGR
ncbi:methionine-S-sulfoxide reductase [Corynebacterium uterequi]|uniref:Peptide methionine sulfoxide reductase MsrA n=2 Tax=Corynebacterium uterequi TaxID=1072256 RepID=A0A0G3HLZ4_9CORY|nr:methionine-S-sulfoxide reductase [Corynebacterium uterequi]